jgi:hypothetical protein
VFQPAKGLAGVKTGDEATRRPVGVARQTEDGLCASSFTRFFTPLI